MDAGRTTRAVALVLSVVLAGCAAKGGLARVDEGRRALADAPMCCASLAEARRTPLPVPSAELEIDGKTSQAFDFGGNKAFFKLFELPPFATTYAIVVTSSAAGSNDDVALFIPRVAFYDAAFKVTRFFDEKTLRNRGNELERTVFVNPSNSGDRYFAVFGSDLSSSIERSYSMVTVTPVVAGPVMFFIQSGTDGKSILRSSPAGLVKIEVQGLAAAKR